MKKLLVLLFVLMVSLNVFGFAAAEQAAQAVGWNAITESSETAGTAVLVAVDWSKVFSDIMTGAVTALVIFICGTIAYAILRIAIPLLPALVQWLKDRNILWLAKILVTAAESALGRFVGSAKFAQVVAWFEKRHITVTDEVKQMIYNAWWQLNKQMIELGLKEAEAEALPPGEAKEGIALVEVKTAEPAGTDPFTGTDQPVQLE
jgi:hypothetical protein